MNKYFLFFIFLIFAGCAFNAPKISKSINFTAISPLIKINDAGFLHKIFGGDKIELYKSGVLVLELVDKNGKICLNGACDDELIFNQKFFKNAYYKGLLSEILNFKHIFKGKNLTETNCGFTQIFDGIKYEICGGMLNFKDSKNGVKIKLKELN